MHNYSWQGYYFLTDSKGSPVSPANAEPAAVNPSHEVDHYDFRMHFEQEKYNLIASGKEWYGDNYKVILQYNYPFRLPVLAPGEVLKINAAVAARSGGVSQFRVRADGTLLGSISVDGTNMGSYTSTYAYNNSETFSHPPQSGNLTVSLQYAQPDSDSEGWLNKLVINGRGILTMDGVDELDFRDRRSSGFGNVARYSLEQGNGSLIWEITDPSSPKNIFYSAAGNDAVFIMPADQIREYVAFKPDGSFPAPLYSGEGLGAMENQNLHGLGHPDMVIITPEKFLEEAERLAQHRRMNDGMDVAVVQQQTGIQRIFIGHPRCLSHT